MNIIELAQECQLIGMRPHLDGIYQEAIEKFAALVAAQEREACAKLVEPTEEHRREALHYIGGEEGVELLDNRAADIRARETT
jgi:hypothetical protein